MVSYQSKKDVLRKQTNEKADEEYEFILNQVKNANSNDEYRVQTMFRRISRIPMKTTNTILKRANQKGDVKLYNDKNGNKCVKYL